MFATIAGREYVIGVLSGTYSPTCGQNAMFRRVDTYLSWIQSTAQGDINLNGTTPEAPPQSSAPTTPTPPSSGGQTPSYPSNPGYPGQGGYGAPCQSGQSCQSNLCVHDQFGSAFCSLPCSSAQDCGGASCLPTQEGVGVCDARGGGGSGGSGSGGGSSPQYPQYPQYPVGGYIGAPCQSSQQCGSGGACIQTSYVGGQCTVMSSGGYGGPMGMYCVPTNVPYVSVCL